MQLYIVCLSWNTRIELVDTRWKIYTAAVAAYKPTRVHIECDVGSGKHGGETNTH